MKVHVMISRDTAYYQVRTTCSYIATIVATLIGRDREMRYVVL